MLDRILVEGNLEDDGEEPYKYKCSERVNARWVTIIYLCFSGMFPSRSIPRFRRPVSTSATAGRSILLFLGMPSASLDALVMATHAIYTMARFGEHEFIYAVVACLALEAVRMVTIVSCHDGLVEDRKVTDATTV